MRHYHEKFTAELKKYDPEVAKQRHQEALKRWEKQAADARAAGRAVPRRPQLVPPPGENPRSPSVLYNGMIAPLIPYGIAGVIWYQGESNANRAAEYRTLFPTMIQDWRRNWKQGDFPFLFVQLAPYDNVPQQTWPALREAQMQALKLPKTGMAVITDVGDAKDIHPTKKEPVGVRLALAARAIAYGEDITYSGPIFESMTIDGPKVTLKFKHAGSGLVAKGGSLTGFVIAGEDRNFVEATAEITGPDTIVVSADDISAPKAVRFGWANYPKVNLWNRDGLPASPFRTDDWPQ